MEVRWTIVYAFAAVKDFSHLRDQEKADVRMWLTRLQKWHKSVAENIIKQGDYFITSSATRRIVFQIQRDTMTIFICRILPRK